MDEQNTNANVNANEAALDDQQTENAPATEQAEMEAGPSEREIQLEQQLKEASEKLRLAENAVAASERAKKQAERDKMSKEEQLTEREKDIAEKERQTDLRENRSLAKDMLAGLKIADDDFEHFVSENKDKTLAACEFFKDFLTKRDAATRKAIEAEYMAEMGKSPPSGGDKEELDPFIEGFKKG